MWGGGEGLNITHVHTTHIILQLASRGTFVRIPRIVAVFPRYLRAKGLRQIVQTPSDDNVVIYTAEERDYHH